MTWRRTLSGMERLRYQDRILLAEAAATTDLLIGGRLNLTLSSGRAGFERIFGHDKADARAEGQRRLARFLQGIDGQTLHVVDASDEAMIKLGTELKVMPRSEDLRERIRYGSGHIASAQGAAAQRLRLMPGTILHSVEPADTFGEYQARLIAAYRAAWPGPAAAPPVAVAASVLPATTPELADKYAFGLEENVRLLTDMARTVGPALGWSHRPEAGLTSRCHGRGNCHASTTCVE